MSVAMESSLYLSAAAAGFATGFSLILAIGAQNAFVLAEGLRGGHVWAVAAACAVSDALLIAAGVAGMGRLADAAPWLPDAMALGGAAFLFGYGAFRFRAAFRGGARMTFASAPGPGGRRRAVGTALLLTWLNPHVYLDTLVLIGALAAAWPGRETAFGTGAAAASLVFFFALGAAARRLAPVFAREGAWRVLDAAVGATMWALAAGLVVAV